MTETKTPRWAYAIATVCTLVTASFAYRPSGPLQLASMCACPLALVALVAVPFALRRAHRRHLPALIAIAASPLVGALAGHAVRRVDFELRLRPRYERLIARIERGDIVLGQHAPPEVDDIAHTVHAVREGDGSLCVVFFWGGGFPVKHTVFLHGAPGACPRERAMFDLAPLEADWLVGSD